MVGLITSLTIGTILLLGILSLGKQYFAITSIKVQSAKTGSANTFNLSIIAEKFRISGNPPIWYPDPYPDAKNLKQSNKPLIQVIQIDKSKKISMVPTYVLTGISSLPKQNYIVDKSRLGSVLAPSDIKKDSKGNQIESQSAFVADTRLSLLSVDHISSFLNSPKASWPTTADSSSALSALSISKVNFEKYVVDKENPLWAKAVQLTIESKSDNNISYTSTAEVNIDAPPSPDCQLELSSGQVEPLPATGNVRFLIKTNSITSSAEVSGNGFASSQALSLSASQSIRTLGTFQQIAPEITLSVPTNVLPGSAYKGGKNWLVSASVKGVLASEKPRTCSLSVSIATPPTDFSPVGYGGCEFIGTGGNCPANTAGFAMQDPAGRSDVPYVGVDLQCCPVPTDLLTSNHTYVNSSCPANSLMTGSKFVTNNNGVFTGSPDRNTKRLVRCTAINTATYKLGPELGGPGRAEWYILFGNTGASGGAGSVYKDMMALPLGIRYVISPYARIAPNVAAYANTMCVPALNALMTRRESKYCGDFYGKKVYYTSNGQEVNLYPSGCTSTGTPEYKDVTSTYNKQSAYSWIKRDILSPKPLSCKYVPPWWK